MYSSKIENNTASIGSKVCNILLTKLREEYGDAVFKSWFSHIKFEEVRESTLVISVPTKFIREWIINNYLTSIKNLLGTFEDKIKRVDIRARVQRTKLPMQKYEVNDNSEVILKTTNKCNIFDFTLDPRLTFESFVVGASNKLAYSVTKAVAMNDAAADSNIVYVQGAVGMGKTHLLQAVAAQIKASEPDRKVAYLSAEKFMNLYIRSVRDNDIITFKEKLRTADILLIDDLQFICGKNSTEQELLSTVTALTESSKKVIVSCDTSPYNLNLDSRGKSRLAGGLVVNISAPNYEQRLDILQSKVKSINAVITLDILELIAKNISSSVRELEGALNKLVSYSNINHEEISLLFAKEILQENIAVHSQQISMDNIIQFIANFYNVKVSDIQSKKRSARFVLPRQVTAFVSKQITEYSLQEIGHRLGNKDHATVIYSIKKIEEKMSYDKTLAQNISKIISALGK